jgi:hypothetical protein
MNDCGGKSAETATMLRDAIHRLEEATGRPAGRVTVVVSPMQAAAIRVAVDVAGLRDTCTVVVADDAPLHEARVTMAEMVTKSAPLARVPAESEPYWRHFERKPKRFRR